MTTQMAFVEMPATEFAEALFAWTDEITKMWELPWQVKKQFIQGALASKLDALLPLTSVRSSKDLISATNSNWAAYIPNGFRGGDAHSAPSYLAGNYAGTGYIIHSYPPPNAVFYPEYPNDTSGQAALSAKPGDAPTFGYTGNPESSARAALCARKFH